MCRKKLIHILYFLQTGVREVVAIKCVEKSSLNKASTENLLTEIKLLKTLNHEHIVQLKDFQVQCLFYESILFLLSL